MLRATHLLVEVESKVAALLVILPTLQNQAIKSLNILPTPANEDFLHPSFLIRHSSLSN